MQILLLSGQERKEKGKGGSWHSMKKINFQHLWSINMEHPAVLTAVQLVFIYQVKPDRQLERRKHVEAVTTQLNYRPTITLIHFFNCISYFLGKQQTSFMLQNKEEEIGKIFNDTITREYTYKAFSLNKQLKMNPYFSHCNYCLPPLNLP